MLRRGQAMIETVIAVLIVTSIFLCLFKLAHMLTGKILLEHAAMRSARARAIGMNDFMCKKAARIAMIPVAGRRLWPEGDDFNYAMELGRFGNYLEAENWGVARGILDYEYWDELKVDPGDGTDSRTSLKTDWFDIDGEAGIERHYPLYLNDQGL